MNAHLILMGLKRSGKSSIVQTVFHGAEPQNTILLDTTSKPTTFVFRSLIDLQITELPGQVDYFQDTWDDQDINSIMKDVDCVVYVIDCLDEYKATINNLLNVVSFALDNCPHVKIHVLVHKIDGFSEDFKPDIMREIENQVSYLLCEIGHEKHIDYHGTSIYNQSIFEVMSEIISNLVPCLPSLENILNHLVQHSKIEKAFLCDVKTKLYFVTDSSPSDSTLYEVCSQFIDLSVDINSLYLPTHPDDTDSEIQSRKKQQKITSHCTLLPDMKIYLKQMIKSLCLVVYIKDDQLCDSINGQAILNYNAKIFEEGLAKIIDCTNKDPTDYNL
ncbi:Gtr2p ASCRUDRAFT_31680 [Ascoidea rubescens DSM 1968]|uniref:GTP-binding protein n=1 Tax=Ascoidea rubescens DSM 1968 TaxID=1344418 RepID=A0A1D2VN57_9ASCO|nr:hypothetical protein ASCRUDRAFT_31680 [Ascoidea rubescens DSM 1968]ODV63040.1 hypothetical protein ASCRUDRAFT_31680 [Ascoidea rubescens DSM 1968]